ncbi:ABC transporter permease [Thalassotalea castellviae]|uniref:FtsX-like permease family protein n=1 Tax=Thalassotalea castellviae TaxID=3075612 RepID=A0ABU3A8F2_9GAMM|nr:FtsX-like permease family protein [Thalassotalea sp. W431]MDT0605251.1 FtsX-like permease family protein [Thalassotalea sp. W431]
MTSSNNIWYKQSLRLLDHELRRGELTIIFLAIVLAVATVFSLTGFSGQIKHAIVANSTNTIAADRVFGASSPIDEKFISKSEALNLNVALKASTDSMVFFGDNMLLSELDAVSTNYPLRGELKIQRAINGVEEVVGGPARGELWVERSVLSRLGVEIGDTVEIGVAPLKIAGILTNIPDRSYRFLVAGPTILMNIEDLPATDIVQPGSRMWHSYLFAGDPQAIETFDEWIKPQVNDTQRWYDAKRAQNRLSTTLDSAERFLSLASMLGIVLAAVAVAVASRRYGQRHQSVVAVFRALGASISHVRKLYCLHWTLLSVISIGAGLFLGYVLLLLGANAIEQYLSLDDSPLTFTPFITAIVTGLLCAVAFAIHPIKTLIHTSPLSVIRGFSTPKNVKFGWHQLIPLVALLTLLLMFSGDIIMSFSLLAGGLLVSIILLGLGRLVMNAGRSVGTKAGQSWHLALANLKRRANENSVQLVSFTIAIKLLLLITVMKTSIIDEWQAQFPEDTPNQYLVNITQEQIAPLERFTEENDIPHRGFFAVYRGRLTSINGEQTIRIKDNKDQDLSEEEEKETQDSEPEGRRGMGRELGLTWLHDLPQQNKILEGEWWQKGDTTPQVSVESGVAERLDIKLGDELAFNIGGREISASVTSLREVNWKTRQLNFIMIFNQSVLADFPATSISAWNVAPEKKDAFYQLIGQYPTISMIDFDNIMKQLNQMIEQVTIAIELILVLVVLAGSLVLVAQVQASMEERERELAILRTLGAKGSLLRNSILFEFIALGGIAGLMASIGMEIGVFFLQTQTFDMTGSFHFSYWLVGILSGAAFVGFIGMLSCYRLLNLTSVTLIRRTM